jgi:hypothetical protein
VHSVIIIIDVNYFSLHMISAIIYYMPM